MDRLTLKDIIIEHLLIEYWPQTLLAAIKKVFSNVYDFIKFYISMPEFSFHIRTFKTSDLLEMLAEWSSTNMNKVNHAADGWMVWLHSLGPWAPNEIVILLSERIKLLWGANMMLSKWFPQLDDEELYRVGLLKPEWINNNYGFVQSPKTLLLWLQQNPKVYFLKTLNSKNERRFMSLWKTCDSQTLLDLVYYIARQELTINRDDVYTHLKDIDKWAEMLSYLPWNVWLKNQTLKIEQKNMLLTLFLHIRQCAKISTHDATLKLTNNIIKMWPNGQYWRDMQDIAGPAWKFDMSKNLPEEDYSWST